MTAAKDTDWREKYLNLVERQDHQEKHYAEQLEQMRRALVRVSLAADGADPELDNVLAALREHLKSPDKQSHLYKRLEVVEEAVIAFDERKSLLLSRLHDSLEELLNNLHELALSRAFGKRVKALVKTLNKRIQHQQELPHILRDIAQLQQEALAQVAAARSGFLQKWLTKAHVAGHSKASPAENLAIGENDEHGAAPNKAFPDHRAATIDSSFKDKLDRESGFPREPIAQSIRQIIDGVSPDDIIAGKLNRLEGKLAELFEQNDLVALLQATRDIVQHYHLTLKNEFSAFLHKTNSELHDIAQLLSDAAKHAAAENSQQTELRASMNQQLLSLKSSVDKASDLDSLKREVHSQLEDIRRKIAEADKRPATLSQQLKALLSQVEKFERQARSTHHDLQEQRKKALHDPLTGLANREAYNERCHTELVRWQRYKNPLSIAVMDLDHFKRINDDYGHQAGDKVLKLIAKAIKARLRAADFIARYGGEEFVVLLPETNKLGAENSLNQLREAIADTPFHFRKQPVKITLSIGVTEFIGDDTAEAAFARADKALYLAKTNGRNATVAL